MRSSTQSPSLLCLYSVRCHISLSYLHLTNSLIYLCTPRSEHAANELSDEEEASSTFPGTYASPRAGPSRAAALFNRNHPRMHLQKAAQIDQTTITPHDQYKEKGSDKDKNDRHHHDHSRTSDATTHTTPNVQSSTLKSRNSLSTMGNKTNLGFFSSPHDQIADSPSPDTCDMHPRIYDAHHPPPPPPAVGRYDAHHAPPLPRSPHPATVFDAPKDLSIYRR